MVTVGEEFPSFELSNQNNQTRTLKDFEGRWLVLYVYPQDGTPGCTIEGKSFSARKSEFEKLGAVVVGLSQDEVKSHQDFISEYDLDLELLSDPQNQLLQATGIGRQKHKGIVYWDRTTFLIDPHGIIRRIYENVQPEGHEGIVLNDLKELQQIESRRSNPHKDSEAQTHI